MIALSALLVVLSIKPQQDENVLSANASITVLVRAGNKVGSGVIVQKSPLTVATCFHVIQSERSVYLQLPLQGRTFEVTQAAAWPREDFALLRVANTPHGSSEESLSFRTTFLGDLAHVVGFSHKIRKGPALSKTLAVANPTINFRELAEAHGVSLPGGLDFEVVDFSQGPIELGDSGGPVFDNEGRLVGLAAGTLQLNGSGAIASFAIRPSHKIPPDAQFRPLATVVKDADIYDHVTRAALLPVVAIESKFTPPPSGPSMDGGVAMTENDAGTSQSCAELMKEALAQPRRTPPAELVSDAGVSDSCRAQYAKVREVEIALRTEHSAVESLRAYALRIEGTEQIVKSNYLRQLNAVIEEKKLEGKSVRGTYTAICEGMQKQAYDERGSLKGKCPSKAQFESLGSTSKNDTWKLADKKVKEKAAAELAGRGNYLSDVLNNESLAPPASWTFTPHALSGVTTDFPEQRRQVEQARAASAKLVKSALGRDQPESARQVAPVVGENAIDSEKPDSSVSLREASDKRSDAVDALVRIREALIQEAQTFP